jgi:hypothetical protein
MAARVRLSRRAVLAGGLAAAAANLGLGQAAERSVRLRDPLFGDKLAKLKPRLTGGRPLTMMLGSSRTGLAFHGRRAEGGVGGVAFNFGVPATGPVTHLVYLQRLLAAGVRPARLFVEVLPAMLHHDGGPPRESLWLFADRLTGPECDTVVRFGFPPAATYRRWRESVLVPWYALRFQLLSRVSPSWLPWPMRFDWSRGADAWGWGSLVNQNPTAAERDTAFEQAAREYAGILAGYTPGGPAAAALQEVTRVCAREGVPVRLVLMPESPRFRAMEGPGFSDRLRAALPSGPIDARDWLPEAAFNDGHHTLVAGAEAFTDRLLREAA